MQIEINSSGTYQFLRKELNRFIDDRREYGFVRGFGVAITRIYPDKTMEIVNLIEEYGQLLYGRDVEL